TRADTRRSDCSLLCKPFERVLLVLLLENISLSLSLIIPLSLSLSPSVSVSGGKYDNISYGGAVTFPTYACNLSTECVKSFVCLYVCHLLHEWSGMCVCVCMCMCMCVCVCVCVSETHVCV